MKDPAQPNNGDLLVAHFDPSGDDFTAINPLRHQQLAALIHQRNRILEALLSDPDPRFFDPFSQDVNYQSLFDALALDDVTINCRNDSTFDLPKVINLKCRHALAFQYFESLLENREQPDRLTVALAALGFRAANLVCERQERFLLLRPDLEKKPLLRRNQALHQAVEPLFRDKRVTIQDQLLEDFLLSYDRSPRLRERADAMEWKLDVPRRRLVLRPHGQCEQDEVLSSFRPFLFADSSPKQGGVETFILAVLRLESVCIPPAQQAAFLTHINAWSLLEDRAATMTWQYLTEGLLLKPPHGSG